MTEETNLASAARDNSVGAAFWRKIGKGGLKETHNYARLKNKVKKKKEYAETRDYTRLLRLSGDIEGVRRMLLKCSSVSRGARVESG